MPDKLPKACNWLREKKFCWSRVTKALCRRTCNTCNKATELKTNMRKGRLPDKSIYEGFLKTNKNTGKMKPEGQGAKIDRKRGQIYVGNWVDGLYQGEGLLHTKRSTYTGNFEKGEFSGFGILVYKAGRSKAEIKY